MARTGEVVDVARAAETLRAFFLAHPDVHIREAGQPLARLGGPGSGYALHPEANRLVGHFWSGDANLVRRIVGWRARAGETLELAVMRLGQTRPVRFTLAPAGADTERARGRLEFRQALLAAAERDWPGWHALPDRGVSGERRDVQRLLFRRQQRLMPCVALAEGAGAAAVVAALAQALVWVGQCGERYPCEPIAAVRMVLPAGAEIWLRLLRSGLRAQPAIECYRWDASAARLDAVALSDAGNTVSGLRRAPACSPPRGAAAALLARVRRQCPQATWETAPDGYGFVSVYGLEIARESDRAAAAQAPFVFGCGGEQTPLLAATEPLFDGWVAAVAQQRVPAGDRRQPLFAAQPERWMAHLLRHDPGALDAQLAGKVYAGIPITTPAGTGVLDLLARDRNGRLVVIEIKAAEDLPFPLQALVYWLQVRQQQRAGEFERLGYFAGEPLSPEPPQLWLVAPALRWHPLTPQLLRWLAPEVPCTLLGINEEWRRGFQVVFRRGAA